MKTYKFPPPSSQTSEEAIERAETVKKWINEVQVRRLELQGAISALAGSQGRNYPEVLMEVIRLMCSEDLDDLDVCEKYEEELSLSKGIMKQLKEAE